MLLVSVITSAQNVLYPVPSVISQTPLTTPESLCSLHLAYEIRGINDDPNKREYLCAAPKTTKCIASASTIYQAQMSGKTPLSASFVETKYFTDYTKTACYTVVTESNIYAVCEDWLGDRLGYQSSYISPGKCSCKETGDKSPDIYGNPTPLNWNDKTKKCTPCPLNTPIPLETLIAQYDTTEESKACTRRLEAGGNCDNLVKPALLTAKACLQRKMAEVGFTWDGSTTSLFRTRGYQAHFWDLFQKRWTKSGLAKLAIDDPSAYKSCTPPPHGVHKNHGLMDTVANPDSVQPHHTTGSAFDVSNDIIRDYKSALKVWAGKHQKDANYKERTITSEAAACGLRWGGNFNDNPHFDLGR